MKGVEIKWSQGGGFLPFDEHYSSSCFQPEEKTYSKSGKG